MSHSESSHSFEDRVNPEQKIFSQALSTVEREALADAWFAMVMDSGQRPLDTQEWDNAKIREWLNETLRHDTEKLVNDWRLAPSTELVEKIQNTPNAELKSQIELQYINEMMAKLYPLGQANERSGTWDSYPKLMRQTEAMNCTSKGLLVKELLNRVKIKNNLSNPAMHTMNVVQLSDGEYCYVDSTTGTVRRIQPNLRDMAGVTVLEINDPDIEYRLLPLLNDEEIAKPVLGNFRGLYDEVVAPEGIKTQEDRDLPERTEAREFYKIFRTEFAATDWVSIWSKLYPRFAKLGDDQEWKNETHRVADFHEAHESIVKEIERHLSQLTTPEAVGRMRGELSQNFKGIESFIQNGDQAVFDKLNPVARSLIEDLNNELMKLAHNKPQLAKEVANHILANWKRFKE